MPSNRIKRERWILDLVIVLSSATSAPSAERTLAILNQAVRRVLAADSCHIAHEFRMVVVF